MTSRYQLSVFHIKCRALVEEIMSNQIHPQPWLIFFGCLLCTCVCCLSDTRTICIVCTSRINSVHHTLDARLKSLCPPTLGLTCYRPNVISKEAANKSCVSLHVRVNLYHTHWHHANRSHLMTSGSASGSSNAGLASQQLTLSRSSSVSVSE